MPASGTGRNYRTVRGHEADALVVEATAGERARARTVAIRPHRREDDTVAEKPERWDTWTRSELLAIRGYPLGSENSPAPVGLHMGGSAVQVDDSLEAGNGSEMISQGRPQGLEAPEGLPEANGIKPSTTALEVPLGRSCSECGGSVPAGSHPGRATCSPPCAQRRHDRLRKSREALRVKVLPPGGQAAFPGPVPVLEAEGNEAESAFGGEAPAPPGQERLGPDVLEDLVHLSTLIPCGWHAEVGPGSVVLSWPAR
jgi:hypothetical protein